MISVCSSQISFFVFLLKSLARCDIICHVACHLVLGLTFLVGCDIACSIFQAAVVVSINGDDDDITFAVNIDFLRVPKLEDYLNVVLIVNMNLGIGKL